MEGESAAFASMKVPELQKFLKERDIQISVDGKNRKRARTARALQECGRNEGSKT